MAKKSSKKKKKDKKWHAPQRNVNSEIMDSLDTLDQASPRLLEMSRKYDAKFAEQQVATAGSRAAAEAAAVKANAPAMREALFAGSPELKLASEKMTGALNEVGPSEIETKLKAQALSELDRGGALSGEEITQVTQGSRAAFADRGLGMGPGATASEIMSRAGASNARLRERQAFAGAVDVQSQQRMNMDRSSVANLTNQAGATFDPYQRIMGTGGSQTAGGSATGGQFQNYMAAGSEAGASNQNAALNMKLAQRNDELQRDQMALDWKSFEINRGDSMAAQSANARAQKSAQTSSYVSTGVSAAASLAMLAFLL